MQFRTDTFLPWVRRAKAFDRTAYFTGLGADRAERVLVPITIDGKEGEPRLYRVSALAWSAYRAGLVLLFQKRVASHKFDYVAVRTYKPATDETILQLVGA